MRFGCPDELTCRRPRVRTRDETRLRVTAVRVARPPQSKGATHLLSLCLCPPRTPAAIPVVAVRPPPAPTVAFLNPARPLRESAPPEAHLPRDQLDLSRSAPFARARLDSTTRRRSRQTRPSSHVASRLGRLDSVSLNSRETYSPCIVIPNLVLSLDPHLFSETSSRPPDRPHHLLPSSRLRSHPSLPRPLTPTSKPPCRPRNSMPRPRVTRRPTRTSSESISASAERSERARSASSLKVSRSFPLLTHPVRRARDPLRWIRHRLMRRDSRAPFCWVRVTLRVSCVLTRIFRARQATTCSTRRPSPSNSYVCSSVARALFGCRRRIRGVSTTDAGIDAGSFTYAQEPRKSDAPQLRDEYRTYKILAGSRACPSSRSSPKKLDSWLTFPEIVHIQPECRRCTTLGRRACTMSS